jgi:dihydropteroate synthase
MSDRTLPLAQPGNIPPLRVWKFGPHTYELGRFPFLMGIVNVTPDSFSDGGLFQMRDAAVEQALKLAEEGAALLDLGGESTRPGAAPVSSEEEIARVIPVVAALANRTTLPISIDTTKAAVARRALAAGAQIVNDISGLEGDPEMVDVCAQTGAGVICMHMQGTPSSMQQDPQYGDVVAEICHYLEARMAVLESRGIAREAIVLDPGIGFGKTAEHNLQILAQIGRFRGLGRPVCIGHSRKRFLSKVLGRTVDERTFGTVGVSLALAVQGADILRLHEIAPTRDCLLGWQAVMGRHRTALSL